MSGPGWDNAGDCARARNEASRLAAVRWEDAAGLARAISLPWYRVQTLAEVARYSPEDRVDQILAEAISVAMSDDDAYRRFGVLAWVLEAALARNRTDVAYAIVNQTLRDATAVTPTKSRAEVFELLLQRAKGLDDAMIEQIAFALLDAAAVLAKDPIKRWRKWGVTYVNRAAWSLSQIDQSMALRVLEGRFDRQRARELLAKQSNRGGGI